ncbi:MAG: isoprenyl transferase [Alphaproteobacteria bacterium]|jgi:undecaprenyl diphosphate synthase|nr:isoprenyl transferase [Alphaproteobacteria bacterium]
MPDAGTPQTPKHIAIIMDGNGRWANRRGLPRTAGHKQGAEAARRVVKNAAEMGVEFVTLFGFSSENWSRPESEIKELMSLLRYYLRSETAELHKSGARLRVIGNRAELDDDIIQLIENAEDLTKDNDKITLVIALNYGGRHDILQAAQRLAEKAVTEARVPDMKVIEKEFPGFLMTAGIPEPDLLIRTSGEQRISNFLLWQCAYSELVFTDTLWPDFDREDLEQALQDYARRERRFGAIKQTGA